MFKSRPGSVADVDAICRIWNESRPNTRRDLGELTRDIETTPEHARPEFVIGEVSGEPVAYIEMGRDIGSYHPDRWHCEVVVAPAHRSRGYGTHLAEEAHSILESRNPVSISTAVWESDPHSVEFAKRCGFVEVKRDFESLLDVATATLPETTLPDGYEIRSGDTMKTEAQKREWHAVFERYRGDVPRLHPPTPLEFEFFAANVIGDPELNLEATTLAFFHGEMVGFSGVFNGVNHGWLDQWSTGVVREHRRKGVALALKCHVIRWARANGITTIRTDNDTGNKAMLAINNLLGFVPQTAIISLEKVYRSETSPI